MCVCVYSFFLVNTLGDHLPHNLSICVCVRIVEGQLVLLVAGGAVAFTVFFFINLTRREKRKRQKTPRSNQLCARVLVHGTYYICIYYPESSETKCEHK